MMPSVAPDHTVILDHEPWTADLPPQPAPQQNPRTAAWMQIPAFRHLPDDAMTRLEAVMQPRSYAPGSPLMRQDEPGDGVLVLNVGSVRVTVNDDKGTTAFERFIDAPGVLGEAAVLTGENRTATVTAQTPVEAYFIDADTLRRLCADHPSTAAFLTALVGDRLMASDSIRKVGKYEVSGRLGSGGVATVFAAVHPQLQRPVALKMLSHALVFSKSFATHFAREARLVAQLDHPNIVRVHDTEHAYGTHFIVMEKLCGDVLQMPGEGARLRSWANIRRILVQVLDALAYSHSRGLVHRDIKPNNIFITNDGVVKLLDFGIAMDADGPSMREGKVLGTPAYMSPEQSSGQPLDGRSDLYSVGILAFELCTGERPFTEPTPTAMLRAQIRTPLPNPREKATKIPEELAQFIEKATAKNPADRYSSCAHAAEALRAQDPRSDEEVGMTTMAVSFPQSQRTEIERIILETLTKLRHVRGARVVLASDGDHTRTATQPQPHEGKPAPALGKTRATGRMSASGVGGNRPL